MKRLSRSFNVLQQDVAETLLPMTRLPRARFFASGRKEEKQTLSEVVRQIAPGDTKTVKEFDNNAKLLGGGGGLLSSGGKHDKDTDNRLQKARGVWAKLKQKVEIGRPRSEAVYMARHYHSQHG